MTQMSHMTEISQVTERSHTTNMTDLSTYQRVRINPRSIVFHLIRPDEQKVTYCNRLVWEDFPMPARGLLCASCERKTRQERKGAP